MKRRRLKIAIFVLLIFLALLNFGLCAFQYFDEGIIKFANIAIGCSMIACAVGVFARFKSE